MDRLVESDVPALSKIHEIGPVIAESVFRYFHQQGGETIVRDLAELGVAMTHAAPRSAVSARSEGEPAALASKTFVVTGKLQRFTRDEIHERIKALGGKPTSSVSAKTDYLIVGEEAGSKLDKAKKLGVAVLSEDEFEAMVAGT
jgi:DNA ligase (NAD+)